MSNLAKKMLEAMNIMIDGSMNKATFDRTVDGIIVEVDEAVTGKYKVNYQGVDWDARGAAGYKVDDRVYFTIPQGDMNKMKQIIGYVDIDETEAKSFYSFEDQYAFFNDELIDTKGTDDINDDTTVNNIEALLTICKEKNYDLLLTITDLTTKVTDWDGNLSYSIKIGGKEVFSQNDVTGHPYIQTNTTYQKIISVDSIAAGAVQINFDNSKMTIEIGSINLVPAMKVPAKDGLSMLLYAPQLVGTKGEQVNLRAQIREAGRLISTATDFKWYRNNPLETDGWESLNPSNPNELINHTEELYSRQFKCVYEELVEYIDWINPNGYVVEITEEEAGQGAPYPLTLTAHIYKGIQEVTLDNISLDWNKYYANGIKDELSGSDDQITVEIADRTVIDNYNDYQVRIIQDSATWIGDAEARVYQKAGGSISNIINYYQATASSIAPDYQREIIVYSNGAWKDNSYQTLIFNEQEVSAEFYTWFTANAIQLKLTDLTNTTWNVPSGWEAVSGYGKFNVNFNYNNTSNEYYNSNNILGIGYNQNNVAANYLSIGFNSLTDGYSNSVGHIFTIIDGDDVTNVSLITWFSENGELQSDEESEDLEKYILDGTYILNNILTISELVENVPFTNNEKVYEGIEINENSVSFIENEWVTDYSQTGHGQEKPYLWNYEEISFTDGREPSRTAPVMMSYFGTDGDAVKIENRYCLKESFTDVPNAPETEGSDDFWTSTPSGVTAEKQYEFISTATFINNEITEEGWSNPVLWAKYGSDANVNLYNTFNALTNGGEDKGLYYTGKKDSDFEGVRLYPSVVDGEEGFYYYDENNEQTLAKENEIALTPSDVDLLINASMIKTGVLEVADNEQTVFSADVDSGSVNIAGWTANSKELYKGSTHFTTSDDFTVSSLINGNSDSPIRIGIGEQKNSSHYLFYTEIVPVIDGGEGITAYPIINEQLIGGTLFDDKGVELSNAYIYTIGEIRNDSFDFDIKEGAEQAGGQYYLQIKYAVKQLPCTAVLEDGSFYTNAGQFQGKIITEEGEIAGWKLAKLWNDNQQIPALTNQTGSVCLIASNDNGAKIAGFGDLLTNFNIESTELLNKNYSTSDLNDGQINLINLSNLNQASLNSIQIEQEFIELQNIPIIIEDNISAYFTNTSEIDTDNDQSSYTYTWHFETQQKLNLDNSLLYLEYSDGWSLGTPNYEGINPLNSRYKYKSYCQGNSSLEGWLDFSTHLRIIQKQNFSFSQASTSIINNTLVLQIGETIQNFNTDENYGYSQLPTNFNLKELNISWKVYESSSRQPIELYSDGIAYFDTNNILPDGNTPAYALIVGSEKKAGAYFNGDIKVMETVYYKDAAVDTSDQNKKNSITPLSTKYLQILDYIEPVSYAFNNGSSGRLHTGLIAQQLEQVMNDLGISSQEFAALCKWKNAEGEDEYGIRYEEFIALLIAKAQQQQQIIDAQTVTLTQLEARIAAIEGKL